MQGRLPRHTVATGYYGEELKSTSAMYFAEKLCINSLFPDVFLELKAWCGYSYVATS